MGDINYLDSRILQSGISLILCDWYNFSADSRGGKLELRAFPEHFGCYRMFDRPSISEDGYAVYPLEVMINNTEH